MVVILVTVITTIITIIIWTCCIAWLWQSRVAVSKLKLRYHNGMNRLARLGFRGFVGSMVNYEVV